MKKSSKFGRFLMELIQILMVYLGVASALTCMTGCLDVVYDRLMLYIFLAIGAVLFYAFFSVLETFKRGKFYGIGGLLLFYVALAVKFGPEIYQGTITIVNSFLKAFMNFTGTNVELLSYLDEVEVNVQFSNTLVLILVGVLVVAIISAFFYRRRKSSVFIIFTAPFVLIPFFVGRVGGFIEFFTYLVILIAVIGTRQQRTNSTDRRLRQKLSVILVMVGLISGVVSYIIIPPARYERNKDRLLEVKNTLTALGSWSYDDVMEWIRAYFSGDEMDYGKIGNKANVGHTGKIIMKVSGDLNKEHGLYLKSFVGDVYKDNKWSATKRTPEYEQDLTMLEASKITPDNYHVQLRTDVADQEKTGVDNLWASGDLRVRNLAFGYGNYAVPVLPVQSYITSKNGRMKVKEPGIDYKEEYYYEYPYVIRKLLMSPTEDLVDPVFWTDYEEKTKLLETFAKKYYLEVPDELKSICGEYRKSYKKVIDKYLEGEGDISDVLKTVRQFISQDTSYTESPGKTPSGEDTVKYFLKESKKGYCTYYASAAAILLRSIGIPTRYVEGVYIPADKIENSLPEEIEVKDKDEHAWVEVYDKRYGFVTFETTPGRGEQLEEEEKDNSGYNGEGKGEGEANDDSVTPSPIPSEVPKNDMIFEDIDGNEEESEETGLDGGELGSGSEESSVLGTVITIIIIVILIAGVCEGQRRLRKMMYRKGLTGLKDKRRRIRLTHRHLAKYFAGRGIVYTGQTTGELVELMTEKLGVPHTTAQCYIDMVFAAAFGPDTISEKDIFKFRETCDEICRHAYNDAGIFKKIYYMYVLVL
ncbi:MAG: transglutaminase-like domain-containing protein [Eubacterium sp.]|nr:transglutaminase-like domain-containing protein [Eubacterium sp.]